MVSEIKYASHLFINSHIDFRRNHASYILPLPPKWKIYTLICFVTIVAQRKTLRPHEESNLKPNYMLHQWVTENVDEESGYNTWSYVTCSFYAARMSNVKSFRLILLAIPECTCTQGCHFENENFKNVLFYLIEFMDKYFEFFLYFLGWQHPSPCCCKKRQWSSIGTVACQSRCKYCWKTD